MLKLNPWYYVGVLIVSMALYGAHRVIVAHEVGIAVTNTETKLNSEYKTKLLVSAGQARIKEQDLEDQAKTTKANTDAKIKGLDSQLAIAIDKLRNRPERPTPTNNPETTSDREACTGRELFKEDGEFLTREAARADKILLQRDYYYQRYEDARKELNDYATSH